MKRILAFTVSVLSIVGCELTHPSNTVVTSSDLTFYTSSQFGKCIVAPTELITAAIDFDKYLQMSEEEMILVLISKQALDCIFIDRFTEN